MVVLGHTSTRGMDGDHAPWAPAAAATTAAAFVAAWRYLHLRELDFGRQECVGHLGLHERCGVVEKNEGRRARRARRSRRARFAAARSSGHTASRKSYEEHGREYAVWPWRCLEGYSAGRAAGGKVSKGRADWRHGWRGALYAT